MYDNHHLVRQLRALGRVQAPRRLLEAILEEINLGDRYASVQTDLGPVYVAWSRFGICAVMKTLTAPEFEERFRERFGRVPRPSDDGPPPLADGRFDLRGVTEFERAVLLKAREIPRGEVRTYGWIAAQIGHPTAVRAVGSALRKNPVPILIPCHRVVRSDGVIGNYALGGADSKRRILAAEGVRQRDIERLAKHYRPPRAKVV
jgi:O-6-methylguanine DNA methyltransferase